MLDRLLATLDLAVERLARDDDDRGAAALRTIPLARLFRLGVSLIGKVKRLAPTLRREGPFGARGLTLAEPDDATVLEAVTRLRPMFPRLLDEPPSRGRATVPHPGRSGARSRGHRAGRGGAGHGQRASASRPRMWRPAGRRWPRRPPTPRRSTSACSPGPRWWRGCSRPRRRRHAAAHARRFAPWRPSRCAPSRRSCPRPGGAPGPGHRSCRRAWKRRRWRSCSRRADHAGRRCQVGSGALGRHAGAARAGAGARGSGPGAARAAFDGAARAGRKIRRRLRAWIFWFAAADRRSGWRCSRRQRRAPKTRPRAVPAPPKAPAADGTPAIDAEIDEHVAQGHRLYQLGRYQEAIGEYRRAYELRADPPFLLDIAEAYRQLGATAQALFYYDRFLAARPSSPNREIAEDRVTRARAAARRPAAGSAAVRRRRRRPSRGADPGLEALVALDGRGRGRGGRNHGRGPGQPIELALDPDHRSRQQGVLLMKTAGPRALRAAALAGGRRLCPPGHGRRADGRDRVGNVCPLRSP